MPAAGTVDKDGVLWKATRVGSYTSVPAPGVLTIWDTISTSAHKHADRNAVGWREVVSTEMERQGDKSFEKYVMGPYNFMTYGELKKRIDSFGAALVGIGLKPGSPVVIFAETAKEWMIAAFGAWRQGLKVVTIYATLGEEGAQYGITQTRATTVICDAKLLKLVTAIAPSCKDLEHIVLIGGKPGGAAAAAAPKLKVHEMAAMMQVDASAVAPTPSAAGDVAIIMYTSGTTGVPKGVLLSHANVVALVAGTLAPTSTLMSDLKPELHKEDVYLAYLPLAHIMELAVEVSLFYLGMTIGYGTPHTLTPTSVKMKQTSPAQKGDAMALSPTVMVFAPAVLDKVFVGIKSKVAAGSALKQTLFNWALQSGLRNYESGGVGASWVYNAIVFQNVQALLGGRVRMMLAGSAPLSPDVQKFVQSCFNAPLRQGYGLTETCAATCLALATDNTISQVGPPQESASVLLRDWEEGNYRNGDKDDPSIGMRRGEILIGGPTVCLGYFVAESSADAEVVLKNKSDFVTMHGQRWFCTGDIGQITPEGNMMIIDRKKDLVKLQQGEYVALSKVENALKNSPFTAIPLVYAQSTMSTCIVVLSPQPAAIKALGAQLGVEGDLAALCANAAVNKAVLADLQAACKKAKLVAFETPAKLLLVPDEWTAENELLTTTMKIKRKQITDKYAAEIKKIYA